MTMSNVIGFRKRASGANVDAATANGPFADLSVALEKLNSATLNTICVLDVILATLGKLLGQLPTNASTKT